MRNTGFSGHNGVYVNRKSTTTPHNMTFPHYHDSYEIYIQLGGKRYVFCDDICQIMQRGDVSINTPFSIHSGQSRDSEFYDRYVLNFNEKVLLNILSEDELKQLTVKLQNSFFHLLDEELCALTAVFSRLEVLNNSRRELDGKKMSAVLLLLIDFVINHEEKEVIKLQNVIPLPVKDALDYISRNYKENISLDILADRVHLSKYHFSHIFKETTGMSVMEHLTLLRLTKVHTLLKYTDKKIVEIAEETGFGTYMNLERAFRKVYGISPRKFKKQD